MRTMGSPPLPRSRRRRKRPLHRRVFEGAALTVVGIAAVIFGLAMLALSLFIGGAIWGALLMLAFQFADKPHWGFWDCFPFGVLIAIVVRVLSGDNK